MMAVLLESRAKAQRRSGGAALSIVTHAALIGAVAVGTVQGKEVWHPEKPIVVPVVLDRSSPKPVTAQIQTVTGPAIPSPTNIVIRHIDIPSTPPVGIPPIDASAGLAGDSIVLGGSGSIANALGVGNGTGAPAGDSQWDVHEVLMNILVPVKPRYPEALRSAGIDGHVLVQFTVDTTGRVDLSSVKVLDSTHELFTRAVREALGSFRFRSAEVGGRRVPALAQMPFEFLVTR